MRLALRITRHELLLVLRGLLRRPAVPLLLVAVVALGVTFLTTAYGVFDALLWRPLPFGPHSRYVMLGEASWDAVPPMPRAGVDLYEAYAAALARGDLPALEALIPLDERRASLTVDGAASTETATWLLPGTMRHLQVAPLLGRFPADPDGQTRRTREIAIGERLWTRRFGGRPDVVGQRVLLDDEPAVVVGVLPAAFQFHRVSQLWDAWSPEELLADPSRMVPLVGRLAEGATFEDVIAQVEPVQQVTFRRRTPPDTMRVGHVGRGPFGAAFVPPPLARLVMGTMLLVLVAACINLATLILARTRAREGDHATRFVLGAGRAGVLRHVVLEVALIVLLGGAVALTATVWLIAWLRDAMAGVLPLWVDLRLDASGFGVALAALAVALLIVAVPAARLTRRLDLSRLLVHKGILGRAPAHGRAASALIATQVALVVILATAALPIALSARRLAEVRSGIDDDRVVEVEVNATGTRYTGEEARRAFAAEVRRRLEAEPGVESVARVGMLGWEASSIPWSDSVFTDAREEPLSRYETRYLMDQVVSPSYFAAVGLETLVGNGLPAGLAADGEPVAVLSAAAARLLWPGTSPVGRRFRYGSTGPWTRVVGVVADHHGIYEDWGGTTAQPHVYVYRSDEQAAAQLMTFYVRVRDATPSLLRRIRAVAEQVDRTQPVTRVRLLAEELDQPRRERRWLSLILGSGALMAMLFAATGVFGLVSYYATTRLPELALRVALGAPLRGVAWLVAGATIRSVGIGVAVAALTLTLVQRFVARFAYETSVFDPLVLGVVTLLVGAVAATALAVPIRRLRRVAPYELLRPD